MDVRIDAQAFLEFVRVNSRVVEVSRAEINELKRRVKQLEWRLKKSQESKVDSERRPIIGFAIEASLH